MRIRSEGTVRPRRMRRLLAAFVLAMGVGAGAIVAPLPAAADPWIVPPGGWCYIDWYNFGSNNGQVHQGYGVVRHFDNQSSSPATWTQSFSVTQTFSSTYTVNKNFQGGLDFGIIKLGVEYHTTTTTFWSITVNETTSFSVIVPAHTLMYAQYGAYKLSTTGTYYQEQFECGTYEYDTVTSDSVVGSSLLSVGWRLWEG